MMRWNGSKCTHNATGLYTQSYLSWDYPILQAILTSSFKKKHHFNNKVEFYIKATFSYLVLTVVCL